MIKTIHNLFSQLKAQLLFSVILFTMQVNSQELPLVNNYSPEIYNAEAQNWSISQSENGYLYVANNLGLLEFNGAIWKLYNTPNSTIMRSVKVISDKIYTGFYMDFGYWLRDDYGKLKYTSLVRKHNIPVLEDEQFWNIIQFDEWILFQSLQRIYFFNPQTKESKIISSDVKITKMFNVKSTIYFQQLGKGLFKIENGQSKLVSDNSILKNNNIVNIHAKNTELIILTDTKGFVLLKNKEISTWTNANKHLTNKKVYNSIELKDKGYAIGTISDGVLFLTEKGELSYNISRSNGLTNNTVLALHEDISGNVWLGLDNGINSINVNSQIKIFREKEGRIGKVYATIFYQGDLYLGTNQGLFVKNYGADEKFSIIEGTQGQVWSLSEIDNSLFCGHDSGTFVIKNRKIISQINVLGTWDVKKIDDKTLLQGNYSGLYILEKKNNKWELRNKVEGFSNSSKSFEIYTNNQIFVNHEYKGVFKLKIDDSFKKVIELKKDSLIGKGLHSNLVKYRDKVFYSDKNGIFEYVDNKDKFIKDTILSKLFSLESYTTGKLVFDKENDLLWSFSKKDISYVKPNSINQKLAIKRVSISEALRDGAHGYENLSAYNNNEFVLGVNNGYILLNLNEVYNENNTYIVSINSIKINELNKAEKEVVLNNDGNFIDKENNIEFDYNVPFLTHDVHVEYQYMLKGYTTSWSQWSTKSSISFENLPKGNEYTFNVKARIGNKQTSNVASYNFIIKNPWYLTNAVIIGYIVMTLLFLLVIDRLYKNYYRKQRKNLLEKQEKDFKLKSLANEKELVQAKNEQLKIDIESKSRELATSTMSIIKKNELLNSLKKELKGGEQEKGVKSVIKIIDKNINNTDDWQMFKEAFNNADKDFIKKLKLLHPTLTPNDLRLCAYLRLNLSSKEIAPLLNISPRSVEVKRYRLRKKMNLEHNDSLTDCILKI